MENKINKMSIKGLIKTRTRKCLNEIRNTNKRNKRIISEIKE